MVKQIKENKILYLIWSVMFILIILSVITTRYLSLFAFFIFAVYSFFSPISGSCALLFGLLPIANIFKLQIGGTSFFTICELLVVAVSILKDRKINAGFLAALLLFFVYILATTLGNFNILGIIKILLGFYIIYLLTLNIKKSDLVNIAYLLATSVILMLLLSINKTYFQYIEPYLLDLNYLLNSSGQASDAIRLSGFLGDPNYCTILIIITITLLCVLYYYKEIKTEFWAFIAFLIPLGFFTYSKSYFLCITALILFLIVFVLIPKYKGWAIVSLFATGIVLFLALSGRIEVFNIILKRFLSGDITTGRSTLNEVYLNYIWDNPMVLFFGEGINTEQIVGASNNVHNIYIEAWFKLGIIGCLLYLLTLFISINIFRKNKEKRKIVNFFPLMFLMVLYFALAGITMYEFPFYLAIAFLSKDFNSLEDNKLEQDNIVVRIKHNEKI